MAKGASVGWGKEWALGTHKIVKENCDTSSIDKLKCTWKYGKTSETIYLVGDSMSWAIGDAILKYANEIGVNAISITRNACSITLVEYKDDSDCGLWRTKAISDIRANKPKLVIISNSVGYTIKETRGVGELVRLLEKSGIKAVVILPPPGGDSYSGRRSLLMSLGPKNRWSEQKDLDFASIYNLNKSYFYDPSDTLCKSKTCLISKDGHEIYTYGAHLSLFGEYYLYDSLSLFLNQKIKLKDR